MARGLQVIAPEGFKTLKKGVVYHMLRSDPILLRVLMVSFYDRSVQSKRLLSCRRYELAILSRDDYEKGLVPESPGKDAPIKIVGALVNLPPWLHHLERFNNLDSLPQLHSSTKHRTDSHAVHVDERAAILQSAIARIDEIFSSQNPERELNRLARACLPKAQNESRFRLWFFCYVAFGYNRWALLPPLSEWGKWDRAAPERQEKKFGRPSGHLGTQFGSGRRADVLEKCIQGFRKFAKKYDNLAETYAATMLKTFGCIVPPSVPGKHFFVHPKGEPFPSFEQFRYEVYKTIGAAEVRKVLYGEQRTRSEDDAVVGSYAESLSNIGEHGYFDSRVNFEHPRSYLSDDLIPKLHVVELIDGLTGHIQGIGFSLASETAQAYKAALFCAAIPKAKFGQILGLPICKDEWYGHGLPIGLTRDRGPGAADELAVAVKPWNIQLRLPPSYTPQSNSTVESKHRRSKRRTGAPEFVASKHTVIQMMRRETIRVITKNSTDCPQGRASDIAVVGGDVKTSGDYWRYMHDRHRSDLISNVPFEDAVRAFLVPIEFVVSKGRLFYQHREYRSAELMECGFSRAMRGMEGVLIKGFCYPMVMRTMWVDVKGQLVEVDAQMLSQDDDAELWVCQNELDAISAARSRASGARQAQKPIEIAAGFQKFKKVSGDDWHAGTRHSGRGKAKTKRALAEVALIKG